MKFAPTKTSRFLFKCIPTTTRTFRSTYEEKEELVASLVHHFLLPEAEKELVRDKIRKKQHNRLKAAHDTIYSQYDRLPKAEPKPISVEENVSYKTEDTLSSVSEIIHQQTTDHSSSQVTVIYSATSKLGSFNL
uniref:Uncharacterized protein n=1 Tax=Photinus pyralis TaxID=7054 RepID=A0A1Y1MSE6_PHOPY